jgi:hypothetical protein
VFSWLRMKKPGPGVAMVLTVFQVFMSITLTTPSFRFGVASTVRAVPGEGDARAQVRHAGDRQRGDACGARRG